MSFESPVYQRGLVWTTGHGRQFQAAVKKGWPIGMLVMAEREVKPLGPGGFTRFYDIIDGQQRTYWLNRTKESFSKESLCDLGDPATSRAIETVSAGLATSTPSTFGRPSATGPPQASSSGTTCVPPTTPCTP